MNRYRNLSHRFPSNLLIVAKHDMLKVVFSRGGKLVTNYLDAKCTLILASDHGSWQITSMWSSYPCGCNRKNQESASGPRKSFYSVTNAPGNTGGNYCCFPIFFYYIVKKMESYTSYNILCSRTDFQGYAVWIFVCKLVSFKRIQFSNLQIISGGLFSAEKHTWHPWSLIPSIQ